MHKYLTISEIIARLKKLAALDDDWDTYNAKPISSWALGVARAILTHPDTIPPTGIYPSNDGGLDIEWEDSIEGDLLVHIPSIIIEEDNWILCDNG